MDSFAQLSSMVQLEILINIAGYAEEAYWALRRAIPLFRRSVSDDTDWMLRFGTTVITSGKSTIWIRNGLLHRLDGPAVVWRDGTKEEWYWNGKLHRTNGPAVVSADGIEHWYRHGQRHRSDGGPAITWRDGSCEWYQNDVLHRIDGPAFILDDRREWYRHGKVHRDDGPAIEFGDGSKEWYRSGLLHREGGPAVERADGSKKWYRFGIECISRSACKKSWRTAKHARYDVRTISGRDKRITTSKPTRAMNKHR